MTTLLGALGLLAGATSALDLTFMGVKGCSSDPLFGKRSITNISCYDIKGNLAQSAHLANLNPNEIITLYADADCKQDIYNAATPTCFTPSEGAVGSFSMRMRDTTTTDVVEYDVKLSDYTGLTAIPSFRRPRYSNFFISTSALALSQPVTLSALAVRCFSAITGDGGIGIYGCVAGPMASILAYTCYYFLARAGSSINNNIDMATGGIHIGGTRAKRELIDAGNYDYLHSAMNITGSAASFIGHMKRDMGYGEPHL